MECKAVRLNHVVFKARFAQDKSQKRSFQDFTDPQQEVRKMLKALADPSGMLPFSSERDARISAIHCFGYHCNQRSHIIRLSG